MEQLKAKLNEILAVIPSGSRVLFLDYPLYLNVGDMLINKGSELFFKENNINVVFRANAYDCDVAYLNANFSDCIAVCHGGGNFGDIYDTHQNLRRDVVSNFKGKVVILPQSLHYNDQKKLEDDISVFQSHPNVHIFVRDQESLAIAQKLSKNAALMPDMAHYLWGTLNTTIDKTESTLYFMRKDCERSSAQANYEQNTSYDWDDLISNSNNLKYKFLLKSLRLNRYFKAYPIYLAKLWSSVTDSIVQDALVFFNKNNKVVTSRLHGHIFSCLLSLENEVLDNSYGKNSRYITQWTKNSSIVSLNIE
jgi:pyruvyl transferase EpsO